MKASFIIRIDDEEQGTAETGIIVEAPALDILKDMMADMLFTQVPKLTEQLFTEPDFVKPKAVKKNAK